MALEHNEMYNEQEYIALDNKVVKYHNKYVILNAEYMKIRSTLRDMKLKVYLKKQERDGILKLMSDIYDKEKKAKRALKRWERQWEKEKCHD